VFSSFGGAFGFAIHGTSIIRPAESLLKQIFRGFGPAKAEKEKEIQNRKIRNFRII